jgi:uncharacterized protein (TIGR01244 family)
MSVRTVKITDRFHVGLQPEIKDFALLAQQGFGLVVNNRPDGEEPGQLGSAVEERAAREAGLAYVHLPVTGATLSEDLVQRLRAAVSGSSGPVFAHCRSGTRSLALWAIGEVLAGGLRADEVCALGQRFGFDLTGAQAWLAHHRASG